MSCHFTFFHTLPSVQCKTGTFFLHSSSNCFTIMTNLTLSTACSKIVAQRLSQQGLTPNNSRPGTPTHLLRYAPTNNGYTPAPYTNIPTPLTPQLTSGQQITPPISGSSPSHVYTNTISKVSLVQLLLLYLNALIFNIQLLVYVSCSSQ